MNNESLIILSEECSEVIQSVSKCLRFGLHGINPVSGKTNLESLTNEIGDVLALVDILVDQKLIDTTDIEQHKLNKKEKLRIYSKIYSI